MLNCYSDLMYMTLLRSPILDLISKKILLENMGMMDSGIGNFRHTLPQGKSNSTFDSRIISVSNRDSASFVDTFFGDQIESYEKDINKNFTIPVRFKDILTCYSPFPG